MSRYGTFLQVNKKDIRDAKISTSAISAEDISDGEILIKVDSFAYTSNNTTYAVFGDRIGYWHFFPVEEEVYGMIPSWGFGEVIASKHGKIKVGSRYYGYYPMGSHLVAIPGKVSEYGWTDTVSHRSHLPQLYNNYIDCSTDPIYRPELENTQSIFRPLFTTSYLIRDMYANQEFMKADQIILTSASSKTAMGLAYCLKEDPVKVVGLTSSHRVEQVKSTGYYDEVYSYKDVKLISQIPSSIVDFSGSAPVKADLASHLSDHLTYLCLVGFVDWEADKVQGGPEGVMFFAPTYAQEKIKRDGMEAFTMALGTSYGAFAQDSKNWININHKKGEQALIDIHHLITEGKADAAHGYIISLT